MSDDTQVVRNAVRITSVLSKHLTVDDCPHCKKLFMEIFEK